MRKFFLSLALLLAGSIPAAAQTTIVTGTVTDVNNNVYASGTVSASIQLATGKPLPAGATQSSGPFTMGSNGTFSLSIASPFTYIFTFCGFSVNIGPLANPSPAMVCFQTPPILVSGINLDITSQLGPVAILGPKFGSVNTGAQTNVKNVFTVTQNFFADLIFGGPNPWVDVREYGVVALASAPTTTGAINSGQILLTVASAANFQVGYGVNVIGAGATNTMGTPAAPTVQASQAAAGTNTGLVVAAGGGGNTNTYAVVAWELGGGLSAASPVTTINTALPLGIQTATISNIVLLNNVATVTTSAPNSLVAGTQVLINGTGNDSLFASYIIVNTRIDNTHFTVLSSFDTRNGASGIAATQGTVTWFNCNHITATPLTGNFTYIVYGRVNGSLAPLGVMLPQNANLVGQDPTYLTFDDFGSPMTTPPTLPPYIPAVPPVSATNDNLVTTIVGIVGNVITLAGAAGNTVPSATVLFDNTPGTLAALAAANFPNTAIYFPVASGNYFFNSPLVTSTVVRVQQAGNLVFNEVVDINNGEWQGAAVNSPCGSIPAFSLTCYPRIIFNGPLGFYVPGGMNIYNMSLTGGSANANNIFVKDGGNPNIQRNVAYTTGGASDYASRCIIFRGRSDIGGTFGDYLSNITLTDLNPNSNPTDFTPSVYFSQSGTITRFNQVWLARRGMLMSTPGHGFDLSIDWLYTQGTISPIVTVFNGNAGNIVGTVSMTNIQFDTAAAPAVANLKGANVNVIMDSFSTPSSGFPMFNGAAITSNGFTPLGSSGGASLSTLQFAIDGVFSGAAPGGPLPKQRFNTATGVGSGFALFTENPPAPAPTVAVQAGGAIAVGLHTLTIHPVFFNGVVGANSSGAGGTASLPASFTTTTGNQQIQVSNYTVTGAIGYNVYLDGNPVNLNTCNLPAVSGTTTSFTYGSSFGCGGGEPQTAGGGPIDLQGPNLSAVNLRAVQVTIASTLFANLGTPGNGTFVYCPDCTIANPCAGGGTGALAKRLNGIWVCN